MANVHKWRTLGGRLVGPPRGCTDPPGWAGPSDGGAPPAQGGAAPPRGGTAEPRGWAARRGAGFAARRHSSEAAALPCRRQHMQHCQQLHGGAGAIRAITCVRGGAQSLARLCMCAGSGGVAWAAGREGVAASVLLQARKMLVRRVEFYELRRATVDALCMQCHEMCAEPRRRVSCSIVFQFVCVVPCTSALMNMIHEDVWSVRRWRAGRAAARPACMARITTDDSSLLSSDLKNFFHLWLLPR